MTIDKYLAEVEAREKVASKSDWKAHMEISHLGTDVCTYIENLRTYSCAPFSGMLPGDGEFIAHSRQDVPRLLRGWKTSRGFLKKIGTGLADGIDREDLIECIYEALAYDGSER